MIGCAKNGGAQVNAFVRFMSWFSHQASSSERWQEASRDGVPIHLLAFASDEMVDTIVLRESRTEALANFQPESGE